MVIARLLKAEPARLVGAAVALVQTAVLLGLLPPTAEARVGAVVAALATLGTALGIRQLVYSPSSVEQLRAQDAERHKISKYFGE